VFKSKSQTFNIDAGEQLDIPQQEVSLLDTFLVSTVTVGFLATLAEEVFVVFLTDFLTTIFQKK
jgi:hypothetical protein